MEIITSFSTRILAPMTTLNSQLNQLFALLDDLCNNSCSLLSDEFVLPSSKERLTKQNIRIKLKIYNDIDKITTRQMKVLKDQIKKWPDYVLSWSKNKKIRKIFLNQF